jgi:hypothetical protein
MARDKSFIDGTSNIPASFLHAFQEFLSAATSNLTLSIANNTTLRIAASPLKRAAVAIQGRWRWTDVNIDVAMPAGLGAGSYPVWLVSSETAYSGNADNTNRGFGMVIGRNPTGAGAEALSVPFGQVGWDGTKITDATQLYGGVDSADPRLPTLQQKRALVGTSGVPSDTNPYVTTGDSRLIISRRGSIVGVGSGGPDYSPIFASQTRTLGDCTVTIPAGWGTQNVALELSLLLDENQATGVITYDFYVESQQVGGSTWTVHKSAVFQANADPNNYATIDALAQRSFPEGATTMRFRARVGNAPVGVVIVSAFNIIARIV